MWGAFVSLLFSVKYSTLRTVWYRQLLRDTVVTFHVIKTYKDKDKSTKAVVHRN
jgi:hypothetical protein